MRTLRLATVCVAVLTVTLVSGSALAQSLKPTPAPKNLRGFLLKPNEPFTQSFARTPAFSWSPVRGARCYEFELATSKSFSSNSVIWSNAQDSAGARACRPVPADPGATTGEPASETGSGKATGGTSTGTTSDEPAMISPLLVPAVSVDLALPWFTGNPWALYARVRAVTDRGPTRWSTPFGFNMQWRSRPAPMKGGSGLVRWTPVEGATGYQVWYPQLGKSFSTNTNVADLRDFYTFHRSDPTWYRTVQWRVRAVRRVSGTIANGLPSVSYGQWSPLFTGVNADPRNGPLRLVSAISDRVTTKGQPKAHELMPAVSFTGDQGFDGRQYELFRVYAATDVDCVNVVFRGSVVGSPAFAPRTSGPLALPADVFAAKSRPFPRSTPDGDSEGTPTFQADWRPVVASETLSKETGGSSGGSTAPQTGGEEGPADESKTITQARVDLPDIDFPSTRYYWTVVPVDYQMNPTNDKLGYVDVESPQDACQRGRVLSFGKESQAAQTGSGGAPFVSGLSPKGRFLNALGFKPKVYSSPLVAWKPVTGATAYQVQWSRSRYPWRAAGSVQTFATSTVLLLPPGTWHYRIRGLNQTQLRRAEMAWSAPVSVRIARPTFTISFR